MMATGRLAYEGTAKWWDDVGLGAANGPGERHRCSGDDMQSIRATVAAAERGRRRDP